MNNNFPYVVVSVVLAITSIGLFYFFVLPQIEKINEQKQTIADLDYKLENTTDYFKNISVLENKLEELDWKNLSVKIDANFMDGPFFVHNMKEYLEGLVVRSGLYLKNLNVEGSVDSYAVDKSVAVVEDLTLKEVGVSFELSGDYQYFINFLDLLNRQALVISVKSVEVSSAGLAGNGTSPENSEGGEVISNNYGSNFLNFQVKGTIPSK